MINFFFEDIKSFSISKDEITDWISQVINLFDKTLFEINYIFCSDKYILNINNAYLNHDYYTDVITFNYCENNQISGDIFISVDTVKSNSELFATDYSTELHRVIIHGVLHLCGLKDKTPEDAEKMRFYENKALSLLKN